MVSGGNNHSRDIPTAELNGQNAGIARKGPANGGIPADSNRQTNPWHVAKWVINRVDYVAFLKARTQDFHKNEA
jgi:hypothetical protein